MNSALFSPFSFGLLFSALRISFCLSLLVSILVSVLCQPESSINNAKKCKKSRKSEDKLRGREKMRVFVLHFSLSLILYALLSIKRFNSSPNDIDGHSFLVRLTSLVKQCFLIGCFSRDPARDKLTDLKSICARADDGSTFFRSNEE